MVREFAGNVEQLKELQQTYNQLVGEVKSILDAHAQHHAQQAFVAASNVAPKPPPPVTTSTSTGFFSNLAGKRASGHGRPRSNTASSLPSSTPAAAAEKTPNVVATSSSLAYKDLASAFYTINSKYKISWECAELLIELGGGGSSSGDGPSPSTAAAAPTPAPAPVSSSVSAPLMTVDTNVTPMAKKTYGRERAITLESKPSSNSRAPTPAPDLTSASAHSTAPGQTHQHQQPLGSPSSVTSAPPANSTYTSTSHYAGNVNASWRASTGRHDLSHGSSSSSGRC
ncbi:hypothetical protein CPB84DRAFT_253525 [Gymnopilus junonius]|uniref:Uncharacterized protein n=1 Tax=Gymnopilus junonius TaxID=109634 RepID=A0A9P5NEY1_GYMJU|nr:hypothetical protein CPB84DRAFT_253525 [Gymnopilus junonius]